MKSSITTYPDQEFSIGPGKRLSSREKYEDKTERLFTASCRAGNYRLYPESEAFCIHKGNEFTNNASIGEKAGEPITGTTSCASSRPLNSRKRPPRISSVGSIPIQSSTGCITP